MSDRELVREWVKTHPTHVAALTTGEKYYASVAFETDLAALLSQVRADERERTRKVVEAAVARADSLWMAFSGADKRSSEELIRASRDTDQAIMDSVADYRDAALLASNPDVVE